MIKISITSGEWEGRTRYFVGTRIVENFNPLKLGEEIEISELFSGFIKHGDTWKVDYSQANNEEIGAWFREEIAIRVFRALNDGRFVEFMDHKWRWEADGQNIYSILAEIEDSIVESGMMISIESDDEDGLIISTEGLE